MSYAKMVALPFWFEYMHTPNRKATARDHQNSNTARRQRTNPDPASPAAASFATGKVNSNLTLPGPLVLRNVAQARGVNRWSPLHQP